MITIYTRPACGACNATKVWLKHNGLEFEELDVTTTINPEAMEFIAKLGATALPVVVATGHQWWSGFQIDKLAALKTHHAQA